MGPTAAEGPSALEFARALAHPLRHRLFFEYHRDVTSPSRAARRLEEPLNVVAYHTRALLSRRCIELVDSRRVRGAVEHFYRTTVEPYLEDDEWLSLPPRLRRAMTQSTLAMVWRELRHAAMTGGFDAASTHMSRMPLELDQAGRDELNDRLRALIDDAVRIQDESSARAAGPAHPVELVVLHFGRASAPEAWNRRRP
jgi:hypothetical protein